MATPASKVDWTTFDAGFVPTPCLCGGATGRLHISCHLITILSASPSQSRVKLTFNMSLSRLSVPYLAELVANLAFARQFSLR